MMGRSYGIDKQPIIDLRSDTFTLPTESMRQAMRDAPIGDDGYDEDPTIHQLQQQTAALLGKEASLFMPSGIMSNQAALMAHTKPGDTLVAGDNHHTVVVEKESTACIAGLKVVTIGQDGIFSASQLEEVFRSHSQEYSPIRVISVENTINFGGGSILPLQTLEEISTFAKKKKIPLHMDGARLWNAVVATGIPAATWASQVDTVCFCLSKGLGAPLGSMIGGSKEVIQKIRNIRKLLGGTMRQAGILAAAGIFALTHHVRRLELDHQHAKMLAEGLQRMGLLVNPWPQTNIVNFTAQNIEARQFASRLAEVGVKMNVIPSGKLRAVTHLGITSHEIEHALSRIHSLLKASA